RFVSPHAKSDVSPVDPRSEAVSSDRRGSYQRLGRFQLFRPLLVGIVHGLAGSAAGAVLVLYTISSSYSAICYMLVFGVGTMAGMMLITATIAVPFAYTGKRFASWNRGMGIASGLASLGFGLFITCQIIFVNGLLTSHASWQPY